MIALKLALISLLFHSGGGDDPIHLLVWAVVIFLIILMGIAIYRKLL
jgi:hypothetical protein